MNVSLTPTLEAVVKDRVESGLYNNASEVIREALRQSIQAEEAIKLKQNAEVGYRELEPGKKTEVNSKADFLKMARGRK